METRLGKTDYTLAEKLTLTSNSVISSLTTLVNRDYSIDRPTLINETYTQMEYGVLISFLGTFKGKVLLSSSSSTLASIGQVLFSMDISQEMLPSFSMEFGNIVMGNAASNLAQQGIEIDITPPSILEGDVKLYGFPKAIQTKIDIIGIGQLHTIISIEKNNKTT